MQQSSKVRLLGKPVPSIGQKLGIQNEAGSDYALAPSLAATHLFESIGAHMAVGSRTTFKKRQKEMARVEKQRDKAARRAQKKEGDRPSGPEVMSLDEATALRSS